MHVRTVISETLLRPLRIKGRGYEEAGLMCKLFSSLVLSIISFCSLYVCVAVVINLLFHIWANNIEYGYAVGVFSAIRIVHLRLGNHLYIHPFFLLV